MSRGAGTVQPLTISTIRRETGDAVTIGFHDPEGWVGGSAGHYVIVRPIIEGREHRRVFSLSSTPELGAPPSLTVKRLPGGLVSTYFVERAEVGDVIEVAPAAGSFDVGIDPGNRRTYFAFAAGSGIVPVMSILRGVLEIEPGSVVRLAYGNRRRDDVIFADELERLEARHRTRLAVTHALSGRGRRIDYRFVDGFLVGNPPRTADVWYLLCGPPGMNRTVAARLRSLGVMDDRLRVEHYLPPGRDDAPAPYDGARVTVRGYGRSALVTGGESLLAALDRVAAPTPYACRSGVCGTCRARLVSGRVDPGVPFALTDEDQSAGIILTCVARPLTPEVVLSISAVAS